MRGKAGFTLIELLVVVLIIGILAAIALPMYTIAVEKSRASEGMLLVRHIKYAIERHRLATGNGEPRFDELDLELPGSITFSADNLKAYSKLFTYSLQGSYLYAYRTNSSYLIESNTYNHDMWCAARIDEKEANAVCYSMAGSGIHHSLSSHNYYRFN